MHQSIIGGFTVTIFNSYNGTQLFITNPEGVEIFAHKVSGNAIERAKEIIERESPMATATPAPTAPASKMISIRERKTEFLDAMKRGSENRLEIFNDWDRDSFYVKNHDSGKEYNVKLRSDTGEVLASCTCPDFSNRRRVCKHLAEVLSQSVFGLAARSI